MKIDIKIILEMNLEQNIFHGEFLNQKIILGVIIIVVRMIEAGASLQCLGKFFCKYEP